MNNKKHNRHDYRCKDTKKEKRGKGKNEEFNAEAGLFDVGQKALLQQEKKFFRIRQRDCRIVRLL